MTKDIALEAFIDLILQTNRLYYWVYDTNLQLQSTTFPDAYPFQDSYQGCDMLFQTQAAQYLQLEDGPHAPHFISSFLNLLWLVDYECSNQKVQRIHVLGPVFTQENTYNELRKRMDDRNLSIHTKATVLRSLDAFPVLASTVMGNYALQLHYLLTGTLLKHCDISFLPADSDTPAASDDIPVNSHYGIYASEQRFLKLFKEGNPEFENALSISHSLSDGVKHNPKDALRHAKNSCLVLITLLSRAAIEAGVSPNTAYDLQDYYTQKIEDAVSLFEANELANEMRNAFFQKVCLVRKSSGVSKIISSCCDYISLHISEKISIARLAKRAGYSEYYFSRKFKQEMGCSITEYITKEKMERAKLLLSTTNMSILDISMDLSFNSRSYFSDTFQRYTGISPGEYRKQNIKI